MKLLAPAILVVFGASSTLAGAATLSADAGAGAAIFTYTPASKLPVEFVTFDSDTATSPDSTGLVRASAAARTEDSFASSDASIDPVAGVLKAKSGASTNPSTPAKPEIDGKENRGTTSAILTASELFRVTGSGMVTITMAVDGSLSKVNGRGFRRYDPFASAGIDAGVTISIPSLIEIEGPDNLLSLSREEIVALGRDPSFMRIEEGLYGSYTEFEMFTKNSEPTEGVFVDEILTAIVPVLDGDEIRLDWSLRTDALALNGAWATSDFLSTAYLGFTTSPGVSIAPSDPTFLSGSAVTPVPLPASVFLTLAGLLSLIGFRRA